MGTDDVMKRYFLLFVFASILVLVLSIVWYYIFKCIRRCKERKKKPIRNVASLHTVIVESNGSNVKIPRALRHDARGRLSCASTLCTEYSFTPAQSERSTLITEMSTPTTRFVISVDRHHDDPV